MKQQVEFVATQIRLTANDFVDKFQLRPEKGWVWLQRILFWMLQKLGCFAFAMTPSYTKHVIDTQKFLQALHAMDNELLSFCHWRGERLLIGPEEYYRAMEEWTSAQQILRPVSFECSYHCGNEICGLKVTVIPWMKGMLVLPTGWAE